MIDWTTIHAAVWRRRTTHLRAVKNLDPVRLSQLIGIDLQAQQLCRNTERFLNAQPANNALLWGARGTGKSSLIKAILNEYADAGLRMVQIDKEDLTDLPEIVDELREQPFRYIIFCDDLSFESGEYGYKALKSVLDGSIELPPENLLIYASSNRRHIVPELKQDNMESQIIDGELHYNDAVEERISLSDRFGLWLSFHPINLQSYLSIVDSYFPDYPGDRNELHEAARLFAMGKASRSGRTAKQFFNHYVDRNKPDR